MLFSRHCREIDAETWSTVPAELRRPGQASRWATANQGRPVDCFLEGPCFDANGVLHLVDIPFGRILRVDGERRWSVVAEYDGWPNGMKVIAPGRALVTDYRRGLVEVDLGSGAVTDRLPDRHSERFRGLNDLSIAPDGAVYFTDQGQSGLHDPSGRVYRWRPQAGGALDLLLDHVPSPNGLALAAGGRTLLLAVTRDNAIWRVPLQPDGGVSKVGRWIRMSGGSGPDGIALDADGGLWVAHLGLAAVWRFDARGEAVLRVNTPGDWPTNIAVAANGDVFVTESQRGELLVVRRQAYRPDTD